MAALVSLAANREGFALHCAPLARRSGRGAGGEGRTARALTVARLLAIGGPAGTKFGGIGELSACFRARLGFRGMTLNRTPLLVSGRALDYP